MSISGIPQLLTSYQSANISKMTMILVIICLRVVYGNLLEPDWSLQGFHPRVLILGDTMPGRVELGNVLLGRNKKYEAKYNKCFSSMHGFKSEKKQTCMDTGYWLGNESQRVTIIDTPAHISKLKVEQLITEDLVDVLREEIRYVHVIVLAFKQRRIEISYTFRKMLSFLQRTFGKRIWDHAILFAPNWRYNAHEEMLRVFTNLTEESWTTNLNKELQNEFNFSTVLPSVFLDCTESKKTHYEIEIIQKHAQELLSFINNKTNRFELKDVESALAEIDSLNKRINILVNSNKERQHLLTNLTEQAEKQTQNFRITEYTLILSGGSIILGMILALILICIGLLRRKRREDIQNNTHDCTCDPEGAQDICCQVCSEMRQIVEETDTLGDCLAECGYSNEEIERIQRIMNDNEV